MENATLFYDNYENIYSDWIGKEVTAYEVSLLNKFAISTSIINILDIGAGTGRHIDHLVRNKKLNITALESDFGISEHLSKKYPSVVVINKDVSEYLKILGQKYNIIYLFFNTFCEIALTNAKGTSIIKNIFSKKLLPKGIFIVGITDTEELQQQDIQAFEDTIKFNNYKANIGYKLIDFDYENNVATTHDTLKIYNDKKCLLFENSNYNKKKWWKEQDMINIAKELELELKINYFEDNIYYIFTRI